ncbi:MAG: SelT/SelW/SelH family protein [Caldilineaceae bacterium]
MSVTKERFAQGLTYAEYKAQMTRNQERFLANEQAVALDSADLSFFTQLSAPFHVLVLAEDWCGDVINNLPVLGRLAEASGKLAVRVFLRDQNLDIMDQYLKEGQFRSIPVFVVFDENFRELGYWIERPASVTKLQEEMRQHLFATDPILQAVPPDTPFGQFPEEARNRLMQAYGAFREEQRAFSDREVVRDLRALVEQGIVPTVSAQPVPVSVATNGAAPTKRSQAKVSITYCASCGYEPQTLELTSALMHAFTYDLAAIELIPWQDGTFDVVINGDLIHSMYRDGGFPESATILQAVRDRLA